MLFESQTYRDFLRDELARRQQAHPSYSQRAFARDLQLSPGELSEILTSKRHLTLKSAMKIAKALHLNLSETRQLIHLIQLESDPKLATRPLVPQKQGNLNVDLFRVVSDWYCFAILNLADCEDFNWEAHYIAKRLSISVNEVRVALERLERVGLIERTGKNFSVTRDYVWAEEGVPSEAAKNYHQQILDIAKRALATEPVENREFGGVGLAIDPQKLPHLKTDVRRFLDEMVTKYGKGRHRKEVFQIELSLFPLSKPVASHSQQGKRYENN